MQGTLTINFEPPYVQFLPINHPEIEGVKYCTLGEIRSLLGMLGAPSATLREGVIRMHGNFELQLLLSLRLLPARS